MLCEKTKRLLCFLIEQFWQKKVFTWIRFLALIGCQVVVQSTQVNSPPTTMECDVVLCTLPLGVLRPPDPELDHGPTITFEPPLPDWKKEAINRMGFGNLNKVCVTY